AKVAAFAPVLLAVASLGEYRYVLMWSAFQLPSLVTFGCLCLGFHRDAPTPPARRLLWWGGGAVLLGVAGGFATGLVLIVIALITVVVRVVAFVRGDFVLGRALSLFGVLLLAPMAFLLAGGEVLIVALPFAVVLVISALAPVRKPRLS
ncbi:MAG: hypothetical protein QOF58_5717, partial [Pseudonocardiales bacterium]|nr:hypothetical protein [Pseudonocardiales bacterium]